MLTSVHAKKIVKKHETFKAVVTAINRTSSYTEALKWTQEMRDLFLSITYDLRILKYENKEDFDFLKETVLMDIAKWRRIADDNLLRLNPNYDRDRGEDS